MKKPSSDAVALLALLVSAIALLVSLVQAHDNRKIARAAVRPIVGVSFEFNHDGTGWDFHNSGLGPAEIEWFDVLVDGSPVPSWTQVGRALDLKEGTDYEYILPAGKTYPAGTSKNLFWLKDKKIQDAVKKNATRIRFRFCYCSVQDECWIAEPEGATQAVENCERPSDKSINY